MVEGGGGGGGAILGGFGSCSLAKSTVGSVNTKSLHTLSIQLVKSQPQVN